MTRADQIRQMDDKDLADLICYAIPFDCQQCPFFLSGKCTVIQWLHEDVGDNNER